jgi:hypothetical protein
MPELVHSFSWFSACHSHACALDRRCLRPICMHQKSMGGFSSCACVFVCTWIYVPFQVYTRVIAPECAYMCLLLFRWMLGHPCWLVLGCIGLWPRWCCSFNVGSDVVCLGLAVWVGFRPPPLFGCCFGHLSVELWCSFFSVSLYFVLCALVSVKLCLAASSCVCKMLSS